MLSFDDFSLAFDYCREFNAPIVVLVEGQKWKLFPSGHAKRLDQDNIKPVEPAEGVNGD